MKTTYYEKHHYINYTFDDYFYILDAKCLQEVLAVDQSGGPQLPDSKSDTGNPENKEIKDDNTGISQDSREIPRDSTLPYSTEYVTNTDIVTYQQAMDLVDWFAYYSEEIINNPNVISDLLVDYMDVLNEIYRQYSKIELPEDSDSGAEIDGDSMEVYRTLIDWHLTRVISWYEQNRNIRLENETPENRGDGSMAEPPAKIRRYCSVIALKACNYMAMHAPSAGELRNFMNRISGLLRITDPNNSNQIIPPPIDANRAERCICMAKVVKRNQDVSWYAALSGFNSPKWNSTLANDHQNIWNHIRTHIKIKGVDLNKVTFCLTTDSMSSNAIRCAIVKPARLSDFTFLDKSNTPVSNFKSVRIKKGIMKQENVKRKECIKKHYSCCERKILAGIHEPMKSIYRIYFYIRLSPCSDCEASLLQLQNTYRSNFVVVKWKNAYAGSAHDPGCI